VAGAYLISMRCIAIVVLGLLLLAVPARAGGGSIRAFVSSPAEGRLASVDIETGHVVRTVGLPAGPGLVAAAIDGSRVLIANVRLGVVTEIDGLNGRRLHVFRGLGHLVDLVLVPRRELGLVRPRYGVVADARGWVDVLDLDHGRIVRRISVSHPVAMALSDPYLWVASAGSPTLNQLDVSNPARARVVAHPDAGVVPRVLVADPNGIAVDAVSGDGRLIRVEAVSHRLLGRVRGTTIQLLGGYQGIIWAEETDGRVLGIRASSGRVVQVMHVPAGSRLAIVGGWLAAAHGRSLRMLAVGSNRQGSALTLSGTIGAFSFAS